MSFIRKIRCYTQCNYQLNRRAVCLKRSWDEVSDLLNSVCERKSCKRCDSPPPPKPHGRPPHKPPQRPHNRPPCRRF